jgi:pimeloyl-ACP methyl ester carboxylesterase
VQSLKFEWNPCYKTRELDPATVRGLVDSFYQIHKKDFTEPQKRMEIFRFLYQAGWYDEAEKELDDLIKEFPAEKSLAEPSKDKMRKLRATLFADEIEHLHQVGRHGDVEKGLELFFKNDGPKFVSDKAMVQVQALKNKYDTAQGKLRQAEQFLKELPAGISADEGQLIAGAAKEIGQALHIDTLPRLETFLVYAQQHEREVKEKRKPSQTPEELLALALSGWLRGDAAAEPDVKLARALWQLRLLLLVKTPELQTIISHCKSYGLGPDVVAQVLPFLPPPDPPEDLKKNPVLMNIIAPDTRPGDYWLQLPPEYHPGRSYPVLIVLHAAEEKANIMLARWSQLAARHGYILVAPVWGVGARSTYQYSEREHALVLDMIRDLRRRFNVDSDRIFLYGREQGGLMAYDLGLSHPDQFAGVLPQNAAPRYFAGRYWSNAQYLPFYVVDGDFNGNSPILNRTIFKEWIRWQYPCIYVEYKGRGTEWFPEELPIMFEWMKPKKRMHPTRELGRYSTGGSSDGEEFKTMRETDNRFYWLTTDSIQPHCLNSIADWKHQKLAAKLQANILAANQADIKVNPKDKGAVLDKVRIWNQINLRTSGVKQVTVWIGPNMIDFTKPVVIRHNSTQMGGQIKVQPSVQTLLEDFLYHWDRQRLFFAKIELKL